MNQPVKLPVLLQGAEACSHCRGECCKRHPGSSAPGQWGAGEPDWDRVEQALLSGDWVIDVDTVDERSVAYYLRPATSEAEHVFDLKIRMTSGFERCNFLTDGGCRLLESERPTECQTLKANIELRAGDIKFHCRHEGEERFGRKPVVAAWHPHSEMLEFVGLYVQATLQDQPG